MSVGKREGVKVRGGSACGGGAEGEDRLIKYHMSRDEDPTRGEVKATVTLVFREIPEEDTQNRTGSQLVGSGGSGVRVTRTPEHTKVLISRRGYRREHVVA
jgi:hypothetical protein